MELLVAAWPCAGSRSAPKHMLNALAAEAVSCAHRSTTAWLDGLSLGGMLHHKPFDVAVPLSFLPLRLQCHPGCEGALPSHLSHPYRCSGVVLVYQEPQEARKPQDRWRLYVFKNGEPFGDALRIHRWAHASHACGQQSCSPGLAADPSGFDSLVRAWRRRQCVYHHHPCCPCIRVLRCTTHAVLRHMQAEQLPVRP